MAHSNTFDTHFGDDYDVGDLEDEAGTPWRWKSVGGSHVPSFDEQGGKADFRLHRTLWENGVLADTGNSFIIHNGCQVHTPYDAETKPYNHGYYGGFQNGESQLFYLSGLAMISRAKVFYDRPRDIDESLAGERTPFGEILPGTYAADANDAGLASAYADHKRAYNWSLTGDWSLRMRYRSGLSLLGSSGWALDGRLTHADEAWIDGWNFVSADNTLHGAGDFDGDGTDEVVVTSDWGIGLLEHDGDRMRAKMVRANDSWLGAWRYNASFHGSEDLIEGIGDFDGDGDDELLITSEWGLGILRGSGSTSLTTLTTLADNNWAGGWRYETHNEIVGIGDVDGDGADDIVVASAWGIGVLTLDGGSLTSIVARPNDTWFGDWRYNASFHGSDDVIEGLGDFDGDGADELLIRSEGHRRAGALREHLHLPRHRLGGHLARELALQRVLPHLQRPHHGHRRPR